MTIKFTSAELVIDGQSMKKFHSRYAIAQHLKAMLFPSNTKE